MRLSPGTSSGPKPEAPLLCGLLGEQEKRGPLPEQPAISAGRGTAVSLTRGDVRDRRRSVWPDPEPPPQGARMALPGHRDTDSQPSTKSLNPRGLSSDPFNYYSGEMHELVCSGAGKKQSNIHPGQALLGGLCGPFLYVAFGQSNPLLPDHELFCVSSKQSRHLSTFAITSLAYNGTVTCLLP